MEIICTKELVMAGKISERVFLSCIKGIERTAKDNEIHPDQMDSIIDAIEELGWEAEVIFKKLGWM